MSRKKQSQNNKFALISYVPSATKQRFDPKENKTLSWIRMDETGKEKETKVKKRAGKVKNLREKIRDLFWLSSL